MRARTHKVETVAARQSPSGEKGTPYQFLEEDCAQPPASDKAFEGGLKLDEAILNLNLDLVSPFQPGRVPRYRA